MSLVRRVVQAPVQGPGQGQGQGSDITPCPETRQGALSATRRELPVDMAFEGNVGLKLDGEARVQVRQVGLDGLTDIVVGQPSVVNANTGRLGCEASFQRSLSIQLPVSITHEGSLTIDLDAFAQLIARAETVDMQGRLVAGGPNP